MIKDRDLHDHSQQLRINMRSYLLVFFFEGTNHHNPIKRTFCHKTDKVKWSPSAIISVI